MLEIHVLATTMETPPHSPAPFVQYAIPPPVDTCLNDFNMFLDSNDTIEARGIIKRHVHEALSDFTPQLHKAITAGNLTFVRLLVEQGVPVYEEMLKTAATRPDAKDLVNIFLEGGWKINEPLSVIDPPILGSVVHSQELVAWLMEQGADPNRPAHFVDITPLSIAVQAAPRCVIEYMLKRGGDARTGQLLHFVTRRTGPDQCDVIDLLIDHGAPLNARLYENGGHVMQARYVPDMISPPLHWAIEYSSEDIVSHLLQRGADAKLTSARGESAIQLAQRRRKDHIVRVLATAGSLHTDH